jgi:predicted oxidoreductase
MKTLAIKGMKAQVTRIAYGCMGIGGTWDAAPLSEQTRKEALASVRAALDSGINFFDHADIYCRTKSEEAFAQLWKDRPGLRPSVFVQSKCGIRFEDDPRPGAPQRYDFSEEHIVRSVEGSLRRLGTDYLDVLLLHRPDPLGEPEEVARAFDQLAKKGKVRFFGVSNHSADQIELLKRWVRQPLLFNQLEVSVLHHQLIGSAVIVNQEELARPSHGEGTLEYCMLHDITIQAWSPLAHGAFARAAAGQGDERSRAVVALAQAMAKEKNVSLDAVLVAWILRHPAHIQPIIGTTKPERIAEACQADGVELSREEWYRLFAAARGAKMP